MLSFVKGTISFVLMILGPALRGQKSGFAGEVEDIQYGECDNWPDGHDYVSGVTKIKVNGYWYRVRKWHNNARNMNTIVRGGLPELGDWVERKQGSSCIITCKPKKAA